MRDSRLPKAVIDGCTLEPPTVTWCGVRSTCENVPGGVSQTCEDPPQFMAFFQHAFLR
jgi:hypothetical protein